MKKPGKIIKGTLEYITQCVLLPGVELNIDDVMSFYKKNLGVMGAKFKYLAIKSVIQK